MASQNEDLMQNNQQQQQQQFNILANVNIENLYQEIASRSDSSNAFKESNQFNPLDRYGNIPADPKHLPFMPGDKYINASVVDYQNIMAKTILAQAPLDKTVDDFYVMCFFNRVTDIIMLCNFVETFKEKSFPYFPLRLSSSLVTDMHTITCVSLEVFEFYEVRILSVVRSSPKSDPFNPTRDSIHITHYWFRKWPDFDVPDLGITMRFLSHIFKCFTPNTRCPIIHCSAGVGRSGALALAILLIRHVINGKQLNLELFRKLFYELRLKRFKAIQTPEQLYFSFQLTKAFLNLYPPPITRQMNNQLEKKDEIDTSDELILEESIKRVNSLSKNDTDKELDSTDDK